MLVVLSVTSLFHTIHMQEMRCFLLWLIFDCGKKSLTLSSLIILFERSNQHASNFEHTSYLVSMFQKTRITSKPLLQGQSFPD